MGCLVSLVGLVLLFAGGVVVVGSTSISISILGVCCMLAGAFGTWPGEKK